MKLKAFIFVLCISLFGSAFAGNRHYHQSNSGHVVKKSMLPGYCEVEIINNSYEDVNVFAHFEDGSTISFPVYSHSSPEYVDLFYRGYCHSFITLHITTMGGYPVYYGPVAAGTTIRVIPYLMNKIKAEINKR